MNNQLEIEYIIQWMENNICMQNGYTIGGMDNNNVNGVGNGIVIVRNGRDRSLRRQYQQQR